MSVILILMIFSLIMAIGFLIAFIYTVKRGAMEDTFSEANKIFFDNTINNNKYES